MQSKVTDYFIKRGDSLLYLIVFLFVLMSTYMQCATLMNLDAANALDEAKVLLSGGKYFFDIYETTPPMFLYLNFPILWFLKYFPTANVFSVFFVYYLFIGLFCTKLCYLISERLFPVPAKMQQVIVITAIGFVYFLIGSMYVGQREYTAVLFTIPYFLLFALRLNKQIISTSLCVVIGILAGIGFSIKPHFCIPFFIAEGYLLFKIKNLKDSFRIENALILFIFVAYLVSTYLIYPDYFYKIIPLSTKFYYVGNTASFFSLFADIKLLYSFLVLAFYVALRRGSTNPFLMDAFAIAVIGYIISYFSQLVLWDYHMLPAFSFAVILNCILLYEFALQKKVHSMLGKIFYGILPLLIYMLSSNGIKKSMQSHTMLFLVILFLLLLLFYVGFFLHDHFKNHNTRAWYVIGLSGLMLSLPMFSAYVCYVGQTYFAAMRDPMIEFMHKYAHKKSVYFISSVLLYEYPAVTYAGAVHVSRFPYLMWMTGVFYGMTHKLSPEKNKELHGIFQYFTKLTAEDIAAKKPEYIFVESSPLKATLSFVVGKANYVKLFSQNPEFKNAWKSYHYFKTVNAKPIYTFAVYKRNS